MYVLRIDVKKGMAEKMLRIGVIGVGHMGRNHVRILSEEKCFELCGIYDTDYEQAKNIAERYETTACHSLSDLLNRVEAVVIAVPSSLHKDIALEVANKRLHVLVEKPLATTSEDARIIVNTYKNKNVKLAVGHVERFNPVFRELQKLVKPEQIVFIEACRYSPYSSSGRIADTTVVEDLMIHDVDLVCAIMGEQFPTSLHGRGESVFSGKTDFATCMMDFGGKSHAIVNASRISQNKERSVVIHTRDSCIHADLLAKTLEIYKSANMTVDVSKDNSYMQDGVVQKIYVPIEEPLRAELISFYESVVNDAPVEASGVIGARAIMICEEVANRTRRG